jgi:hypothetical protein
MKPPRDGWDADEREALALLGDELDELAKGHANDPPLAMLRAGAHDALPTDLQPDVTAHLSNSPWSRALVEGIDAAVPSLRAADEDRLLARIQGRATQPADRARRWPWLAPALVGSALAAAVLALWTSRHNPSPSSTAAVESPREIAAAAPQVAGMRLPLEQPEVMVSTAALTWRGTAPGHQLLVDLKPAVDAFRKGDYARADREFGALEPRYPGAVEVFYYGGVSRLYLDDPQGAIVRLRRARELADPAFASEIDWYRAIAEQRAGHPAELRALLDALCLGTSTRAARACEAAKRLGPADGR